MAGPASSPEAPPQPSTSNVQSSCDFFDDFESGLGNWVLQGNEHSEPAIVSPGYNSSNAVKLDGGYAGYPYIPPVRQDGITFALPEDAIRATVEARLRVTVWQQSYADIFFDFLHPGQFRAFWPYSQSGGYAEYWPPAFPDDALCWSGGTLSRAFCYNTGWGDRVKRFNHRLRMGAWNHVKIVYDGTVDGGTLDFYENGVQYLHFTQYGPYVHSFKTRAAGCCGPITYLVDDVCLTYEPVNQPPTADAGPDQTVECTSCDGTAVSLDGTGSSDPDNDPLTYTWTGPFPEGGGTVTGPTPTVSLPLGSHTITLTVDDGNGAMDSDDVQVDVVDTTPPAIDELTVSPDVLWPPNHMMVTVEVLAVASDACDELPQCAISEVESNEVDEGLGDGDFPSDILITGDLSVDLRAERSGLGSGRVYTIMVACVDASGNESEGVAEVSVPLNQGGKP